MKYSIIDGSSFQQRSERNIKMKNLTVIETGLVPVYETSTGEKVVYGTELYSCLESKRQYTDWLKTRLQDCDAIENEDFQSFSQKNEKGGRPQKEYIIKLDIAKEMAMLERNEKGKQVRRYFIQIEKQYKTNLLEGHSKDQKKTDRTEIMLMNARSRMAQTYLKLAQVDTLSTTYKTILTAKAAETLAGESLLPLPKSERKVYSASEIGAKFGITANMVGRIANKHGLKTEKYGEYRRSKSEHSAKEIDTWVYFYTVLPVIKSILEQEVA